jgi:hypothetical protein
MILIMRILKRTGRKLKAQPGAPSESTGMISQNAVEGLSFTTRTLSFPSRTELTSDGLKLIIPEFQILIPLESGSSQALTLLGFANGTIAEQKASMLLVLPTMRQAGTSPD